MVKVFQYIAVFLLLIAVVTAFARAHLTLYKPLRRIKIGEHPLWEFMAVDALRRRLLLSHLQRLLVIDMDRDEIIAEIAFPAGVYGIALAPGLNKGFVGHRSENAVSVFDLQTLLVTGRIESVGLYPEALLYDAYANRLFTCNGRDRSLTVIDPVRETILQAIPLPGQPALAACDEKGRLLVSLSNSDELLQIDTTTLQVVERWTPAPGEAPGGMAFDHTNDLLFCAFDDRLLVMDAATREIIDTVSIGNHPGAVVYDRAASVLYVANGQGTVSIIKQLQRYEYKTSQKLSSQAGCRSMAFDPVTKKIYLPAMQYLSARKPVAGSFELLVFGY